MSRPSRPIERRTGLPAAGGLGETLKLLLLTDRLKDGLRLRQILDAAERCALVGPGQSAAPSPDHGLIVCDVAPDGPAALAALQAVLAHQRPDPCVPLLHLARAEGGDAVAQAEAIDATAVLPPGVSDAQVLFTAKQMIGAGRLPVRRPRVDRALGAGAQAADAAFGDVFEAARRGRSIAPDRLEQGGNAVIAAVGGGRIGAWLDVVRNHDDITYQHCLLVAGLAAGFAARLGVTLKGQRLIVQAALVHDIGKASIPQAILNKAGPLSPSEMATMRTHATVGHDMLAHQGGFDPQLLDIVRHHHEYVDGSGYPDALSGERVSALVRLVTICDIYAALVERRSYKAPAPARDALATLAEMGGKLDAGLLRAFTGMMATV